MTAMPELVALLHSFVGLAAVLVGIRSFLDPGVGEAQRGAELTVHLIEIYEIDRRPWARSPSPARWSPSLQAARQHLGRPCSSSPAGTSSTPAPLVAIVVLAFMFVAARAGAGQHGLGRHFDGGDDHRVGCLGVHLVMAIGGADMPVVVSLLNSYSGWAASAAGFMLGNDLLIITGALVGSSGAILSYIMCRAMNRSIWNVVFGGFGTAPTRRRARRHRSPPRRGWRSSRGRRGEGVAAQLGSAARDVVIVPGYGMAVARAQHAVEQVTRILKDKNVRVRFAIHPVAGRLPGHMNVLLAEAGVPYDIVLEMDEINDDLPRTDVVLVIGANDIVNPGAQTDTASPIYGMPVLEVWKADRVVVFKRSLRPGYAGVQNPLFFHERTEMLFGDARDSVEKINAAFRG